MVEGTGEAFGRVVRTSAHSPSLYTKSGSEACFGLSWRPWVQSQQPTSSALHALVKETRVSPLTSEIAHRCCIRDYPQISISARVAKSRRREGLQGRGKQRARR